MNIAKLQDKLLTAARSIPEDDRVPYAFEQRIMAHIRRPAVADRWTIWARWMWQTAVPCLGLTAVLCVLGLTSEGKRTQDSALSDQFETAVYAVLDDSENAW